MCYEEPVTADNWGGLFDGDDAANAEITDDWDKPSTASTDEPSLVHVLRHDPPLLVESRLYALRVAQELGARPRAGGRARVLTGEDDGDHQPHDLGLGRVAPVPVPGLHQALQHVVVSGSDGGAPARPDDLGEDTRERCAHTITLPQHRRWGVQEQKAGQIRDLLPHLVDFVKHPLPHLLPQQAPRRDQQQHLLVVPSTINIRVPTNCSMKYPCHIFDVAVMALMSAGCSNKELELAPHTRCWSAQLSNIWMGNGCYAYGELCFLWKPPWRGFICVQECMLLQFDSLNILASQASEISSPSVIIPTEQLKVLKILLAEGFMVNGTVLNFYADNWHYRVVVQWEHPVNWANDCSASFCWIWKPPGPLVNLSDPDDITLIFKHIQKSILFIHKNWSSQVLLERMKNLSKRRKLKDLPSCLTATTETMALDHCLFHFIGLLLKFLADQGAEHLYVMVWDPGGIDAR